MTGGARGVGLMLVLAGGCATASTAPDSGSPTVDPSERTATDPASPQAGVDAQLDRELAQYAERVEQGEPSERLRARIDLADAMLRRAGQIEVTRFELEEQRHSATGSTRADLDRLDAELATQHAQWLERAEAQFREAFASSEPQADSVRTKALYGLAEALTAQGKLDEALATRVALIRDAPEDPLTGSTLLLLADQAFGDMQLEQADALYERAALFDDPGVRYYSIYKRGWVAFNLDRGEDALAHWYRVAREARREPSLKSLAEAAAKDCVLAYAQVGRPERAKAFFERLDAEHAPTLLRRLAQMYRDAGRNEDAAMVDDGTRPDANEGEPAL